MNQIGQFFTTHLTMGLTNTSSSVHQTDQRLREFCQRLKSVSNSGIAYNGLVSNNARRTIDGDLRNINNLEDKISASENKIIRRITIIKSQGGMISGPVTESRVRKNIGHLEQRIEKACRQVVHLHLPAQHTVPGYATDELNRFITSRNNFSQFVQESLRSAPPYEPPPSYSDAVKK